MPIFILDNAQQFTAVKVNEDLGAVGGKLRIPSTCQVSLGWALDGGRIGTNVLYGKYSGGFVPTTAIANSMITTLTTGAGWTALAGFLAPGTLLAAVKLRDVNVEDQPIIENTSPGAGGTAPGFALPNEVAAVITLRTAKAGKSFRGRTFIPGWSSTALGTGNVMDPLAVTALENWATNNLRAAMNSNGLVWVLGLRERAEYTSPKTGTHFDARDATTEVITSQQVKDNHWDSQRRRGFR